ncbi:hypothetical protein [Streptomyces sp. NPDC088554]|uniref:hypothetical protein n=1 Tax=Streptomyces sp. NPDC088554 TaxID=3365865 RepID=UPI0037FB990F
MRSAAALLGRAVGEPARLLTARGNRQLSRVEQIKRFKVIPAYGEGDGDELTAPLEPGRRRIAEKCATDIAALPADPPADGIRRPAA